MNKTCETCAFFVLREWTEKSGFCRRFPPTILINVHLPKNFISTFSDCLTTDWCGEWRKEEDEENE